MDLASMEESLVEAPKLEHTLDGWFNARLVARHAADLLAPSAISSTPTRRLSPLVEMSSRQLVAGHPAHLLTAAWNVGTAHGATSHFCFARGRVRGAGEEHLRGRREFPDRPRGNISPTACQRLSSSSISAAPHLRNSGTRLPYKALTPQPYIACVHRSYLAIVSDVSC